MLDVTKLLTPDNYDHPVSRLELLETHISWVILTGPFAYKIKKPVNLGFLDFSSLEKRRHFCEEELRLNRRLAPHIYLAVVPLRGSVQEPHFSDHGELIDYAVKMRQFPQTAQLDRLLQEGALQTEYLDAIADVIARFHLQVAASAPDDDYGGLAQVWQPVAENFAQIRERETAPNILKQLDDLFAWSLAQFERLQPDLQQRKQSGFVRECHGDLHLRNIAWFEDKPVIFDCIEFNPQLRWIDVISDLAFLFMDLIDRGQQEWAYRLLDRYLMRTGDYAGLAVLPFYVVYRAMVRAKVDRIRLSQADVGPAERATGQREYCAYLQLAQRFSAQPKPTLFITWGLSGSGKSTISSELLEQVGAVRLRSDVERKRLAGIDFMAQAPAAVAEGIYTTEMTERTYSHLLRLSEVILAAGFSVIVDAAFLEVDKRAAFSDLARRMRVPFIILQCTASAICLRQRVRARRNDVSDANLAILEHQLQHLKPLAQDESYDAINVDTEHTVDIQQLLGRIREHITHRTEQ